MPDPDPCTLLRQADKAWFEISTGTSVREVQDQNGERVVYSGASKAGLLAVIARLQTLCPTYTAVALLATRTRPVKFLF